MIKTYVSRYVIPFTYDKSNDGYEKLILKFKQNNFKSNAEGKWCEETLGDNNDGGGKIFPYIRNLLIQKITGDDTSIGVTFSYKAGDEKDNIDTFKYCIYKTDSENQKKIIEKKYDVNIEKLGSVVFKNGIGFLWYELKFAAEIPGEEEYLEFQNHAKNIAYKDKCFENSDEKGSYRIADKIKSFVDESVQFWMQTEHGTPQIAYLFQYVFLSKSEDEADSDTYRRMMTYRIANGYTSKYNPPMDLMETMYEPFGNVSLYVGKPGMAYVVEDKDTSDTFFKEGFTERFRNNYFLVYVLLLYQEFSCIRYSKMLSELPLNLNSCKGKKRAEALRKIDFDYFEINEFLVKCMFGTVSEITHYNYFYQHAKKSLFIEEEIRNLTLGLEPLKSYLDKAADENRTKKDKRRDAILGVFVFFQMFSILVDALGVVDYYTGENPLVEFSFAHRVMANSLITAFIVIIVVLLINWIIDKFIDK